jgi:hypothetical protein
LKKNSVANLAYCIIGGRGKAKIFKAILKLYREIEIFEEILKLHGNNIGEKLNLTGEIDYL